MCYDSRVVAEPGSVKEGEEGGTLHLGKGVSVDEREGASDFSCGRRGKGGVGEVREKRGDGN